MDTHGFCGTLSLDPWLGDSFGLCFFQLFIYTPICIAYLLLSLVFCLIYRKSLAFDTFQSSVIWFRIFTVTIILCVSLMGILLSNIFPLLNDAFVVGRKFELAFHGTTALLWTIVLIHDALLGKSADHSTRGPLLHLLLSICYFYACLAQCWSAYRQISGPWRTLSLSLRFLHLVLVCLHLLSKVPIIHNTEHPRIRRARLARMTNNCIVASSETITSDLSDVESNFFSSSTAVRCDTEEQASWISRVLFCWMNGVISSGYFGELKDVSTLPKVPGRLSAHVLESKLPCSLGVTKHCVSTDEKNQNTTAWPFLRGALKIFGWEFAWLAFLKLLLSSFSLASPIFLNHFILSLSSIDMNFLISSAWGCAVVLSTLFGAILGSNYNYLMSTFGYKIRVAVSGMVYRRILAVPLSLLNDIGTGSLVNFLTSDSERIVNLAPSVQEVWAMPLQFTLAIVLLYQQLGVSCFVGVGFLCVLLPLNRLLATQIGKFSQRLMRYKDARIKLMSEVLPSMTAVKVACWESLMQRRIKQARKEELRALWGQKMLDAGCVFCWAACPALLASSTFATYTLLGNKLEASVVFTSLALFGMLIGPMNAFPWVINGVIEATVSVRRLIRLLSLNPGPFPQHVTTEPLSVEHDVNPIFPPVVETDDSVISLRDASFCWSNPEQPVLSNISLKVKEGQLVGIIGPVGSGKSALLLAILGELQPTSGYSPASDLDNQHCRPRYAYVSQTPWICSGTVRENILFGLPLDSDRLNRVVEACALGPDLASFPHGLDTDVGEAGGSRLSGGQRARVALARAVYQDADIYLLDDPLAALDVHVGEYVRDHCLLGLLANKTRLITAHQSAWLMDQSASRADLVLELSNGQVVNQWRASSESTKPQGPVTEPENRDDVALLQLEQSTHDPTESNLPAPDSSTTREAEDWERLAFGSIKSHVYWAYLRSVGYWLAFGVLLSLVLMQGTRNAADWWLAHWVQLSSPPPDTTSMYLKNVTAARLGLLTLSSFVHSTDLEHKAPVPCPIDTRASNQSFYFTVYGSIVGANVLITTFRAVLFALGGLAAAATIHQNALETVLHARISFFDRTPQGRILNRFSSDVGTVDDSLPFILNIFLASVVGLIGVVVIACLSLPLLLFFLLPLTFIFWSVQRIYRGASRDLKRLSSVTRSPVYAHFSDTLSGLAVIRGLGQQLRFRQITADRLGTQLRAEVASLAAGAWLSVRLQLMATGVVIGVVCVSLLGRVFGWTEVSAAGLSAAYALSVASLMTDTVYVATETEKNLIAVERCQELTEDTPVEPDSVPVVVTAPAPARRRGLPVFRPLDLFAAQTSGTVSSDWPSTGRIEFRNVSLTYRHVLQSTDRAKVQALDRVSFTVESGDRLGIVGRTGSGKSSLLRVLLRLVDHLPGPYTNERIAQQTGFLGASGEVFIDGVDIRTISLVALRTHVLAVPQEPFLFSGCLRDNLDPEGVLSDEVLCDALVKCQLAFSPLEAVSMLSLEVGEAGRNISAGQRQLVCLARALLRQPRPRIICLDEATAAIDTKAEEAIHDILLQEFSGTTVLLIAHRLSSVRRLCSRVLVMQSGHVIAQGAPEQILADGRIQLVDDKESHDLIQL